MPFDARVVDLRGGVAVEEHVAVVRAGRDRRFDTGEWPAQHPGSQRTASGLSGSPTLATNRSRGRSSPEIRRRPASACAPPAPSPGRRCTRTRRRPPDRRRTRGGVVGHEGLVDVDGTFRCPGGPAGEVAESHVVGVGRRNLEVRSGRGHEPGEVERPFDPRAVRRAADEQHVLEAGERGPDRRHFPAVERFGRDEDPAVTQRRRWRIGSGPNAGNNGETTLRASWPRRAPAPGRATGTRALPGRPPAGPGRWRTGSSRAGVRRTSGPRACRRRNRSATRSAPAPAACQSTASWAMLRPRPPGRPSSSRRACAHENVRHVRS